MQRTEEAEGVSSLADESRGRLRDGGDEPGARGIDDESAATDDVV